VLLGFPQGVVTALFIVALLAWGYLPGPEMVKKNLDLTELPQSVAVQKISQGVVRQWSLKIIVKFSTAVKPWHELGQNLDVVATKYLVSRRAVVRTWVSVLATHHTA
jgi:TctA family transporter